MKRDRKIVVGLLTASILMVNSLGNIKAYANDSINSSYDVSYEEKINSDNNLLDALNTGTYESIKKINVDNNTSYPGEKLSDYVENESSTPNRRSRSSAPNIKSGSNSQSVNLPDGTYVVDRKDGWVLGNDEGFLKSMIVPAGTTGFINVSKSKGTSHNIVTIATATFNVSFVSAAIKAGYGYANSEKTTITVNQSVKAPADKDLFVKAQTIHRRYDTVNIKNKKIVDLATTYVPVSHKLMQLEFEPGTKVNQNKLFEKVTRNVFGNQEIDNKHITDKNIAYEKTTVINGNFKYDFELLNGSSNTAGLYFTVENSGTYNIGSYYLSMYKGIMDNYPSFGAGIDMTLYKLSDNNDQIIEKVITSVPTKNLSQDVKDTSILDRQMKENMLSANLKRGERYLLVLNKDNSQFKYSVNGERSAFSYTVVFNKK